MATGKGFNTDTELYNVANLTARDKDFVEAVDSYFYEMCIDEHVVDDYIDELSLGSPTMEELYIGILRNFVEYQQSIYVNCRQDYITNRIDGYTKKELAEILKLTEGERSNVKNIDDYRANTPRGNS